MTCLVSSSAPQPDDRNHGQTQAGGLAITMVGTAMNQLRSCWCGLGFDGGVFLAGEELQSSLAALASAAASPPRNSPSGWATAANNASSSGCWWPF